VSEKEKVAIVTPAFNELNEGFSLVGIVKDQVQMLRRFGHEVSVIVSETFSGDEKDLPVKPIMPRGRLIDYHKLEDFANINPEEFDDFDLNFHKGIPDRAEKFFLDLAFEYDIVLTHDILLTGWNLPYYLGLKKASKTLNLQKNDARWFHWLHSVPNHRYDWWDIKELGRSHRLVIPNKCYRELAAEVFQGDWELVRTIPHIRDIRNLGRFTKDTWDFIDRYPEVLQNAIVQVYPASTDRLEAKRLREVILIFKEMKNLGYSVCLVCANQWATGMQRKEDTDEYRELALRNGLGLHEFIFTSDFKPEYEVGIPHEMLMDLLSLSNVFVFPTISESFGLCLPEACLMGGVLPVINAHLDVLNEVTGHRGMRFGFGSFDKGFSYDDGTPFGEGHYLRSIAGVILGRMEQEESIACKTIMRRDLNMDTIYNRWYMPLFKESMAW